jgi:hypothetical protein
MESPQSTAFYSQTRKSDSEVKQTHNSGVIVTSQRQQWATSDLTNTQTLHSTDPTDVYDLTAEEELPLGLWNTPSQGF